MRYNEDYKGYELGHYVTPRYKGYDGGLFFLLLMDPNVNPYKDYDGEKFLIRLGKTRYLSQPFFTMDCTKVLLYLNINGGSFEVYDITFKQKKDGTKYFDAIEFLTKLNIQYEENTASGYRYFKSRHRECFHSLILQENDDKFSEIQWAINADDHNRLCTYYKKCQMSSITPVSSSQTDGRILMKGYYLVEQSVSTKVSYRNVAFAPTVQEIMQYFRNEFLYSSVDTGMVESCSESTLMNGIILGAGQRDEVRIQLVHEANIDELLSFMDETLIHDDNGDIVKFSDIMNDAESFDEIREIINDFNWMQDNVW